jgi:nucleoside-diphosphate-sugar epimerase
MSKTLGELYITSVKWKYKVIRYFNVYGPGQIEHFIPDFIESVIAGKPKLKGYQNTRSFLYVDDAISLTLKVIKESKLQNEIVNVGSESETSILEVAKKIMNIMKCEKKLVLEDHPKGSVLRRCPDTSKIKNILHFLPKTTLEEGLKKTIKSLI